MWLFPEGVGWWALPFIWAYDGTLIFGIVVSICFVQFNLFYIAGNFLLQNLNGNEGFGLNVEYENEGVFELEGVLLLEQHIPFNLQTPSPMPAYLNVHYICESASRLLFLSVHWARSIPAFQLLRYVL